MASEVTPLLPSYKSGPTGSPPQTRRRGLAETAILALLTVLAFATWLITQSPVGNAIWAPTPPPEPIRIGVVGAGPAGVFAAAHLRKLSKQLHRPVLITVFERKSSVGGRLMPESPIYPFEDKLETPFSAESSSYNSPTSDLADFVPDYMSAEWSTQFRDNVEDTLYVRSDAIELTRPSSAASWGSWLWEMWCFGTAYKNARGLGSQYRKRILGIQKLGVQRSMNSIVEALDLDETCSTTGTEALSTHHISDSYRNKVLEEEAIAQYGQPIASLSPFDLGMIAYGADDAKSRKGDHLPSILHRILSQANVELRLNTEAFGIRKINSTKWVLASRKLTPIVDEVADMFDGIILAAPFPSLQMEIRNSSIALPRNIEYLSRHLTWFTSSAILSSHQMGMEPAHNERANRIITRLPPSWKTQNYDTGFIEILKMGFRVRHSTIGDVQEYMYRVLSDMYVSDDNVRDLLGGGSASWIARHHIENAHPKSGPRTAFPPMVLDNSIWYPSAIEALHSSVGMSAWAGKNIAQLVVEEMKMR